MSAQGLSHYRAAARHAAMGWSANKSIKSFDLPYMSTEWEMARKGFRDMRDFMELKAIHEQVAAEKDAAA